MGYERYKWQMTFFQNVKGNRKYLSLGFLLHTFDGPWIYWQLAAVAIRQKKMFDSCAMSKEALTQDVFCWRCWLSFWISGTERRNQNLCKICQSREGSFFLLVFAIQALLSVFDSVLVSVFAFVFISLFVPVFVSLSLFLSVVSWFLVEAQSRCLCLPQA